MEDTTLNRVLKICVALQKACKGQTITMQRQPLHGERVLFTFRLDEGGAQYAEAAYSEGYFESDEGAGKLAQQIYEQLTKRLEWLIKSHRKEK